MAFSFNDLNQNVDICCNNESISIAYTRENYKKLQKLVPLFKRRTLENSDVYYCGVHYINTEGYEITYITWWYCDIENAQEVYELFCNEFEISNDYEAQKFNGQLTEYAYQTKY